MLAVVFDFIVCLLVFATWHFQRTISKSTGCWGVGEDDHSSPCRGGTSIFIGDFLRWGTLDMRHLSLTPCMELQHHGAYLVPAF